jgi:hypothetical protein
MIDYLNYLLCDRFLKCQNYDYQVKIIFAFNLCIT